MLFSILEREKRRGQKRITDPVLLRKIILFLTDNIGSGVSIASIGNTLVNEELLEDGKRKGTESMQSEDVRKRELAPLRMAAGRMMYLSPGGSVTVMKTGKEGYLWQLLG